ncbi:MAG: GNAT family N-acetyltransferase [Oceanospirillaceae bacterium]
MKVSITAIDCTSEVHKTDLKKLYSLYSDELPVNIDASVVDMLLTLPFLKGFLCYQDDQAAGFAVCYESFSTYNQQFFLNIHDLMIAKAFRGNGLSRILLEAVLNDSRAKNYLKVTLEVDDENTVAKSLYQSCGFEDHQVILKGLQHWQVYL